MSPYAISRIFDRLDLSTGLRRASRYFPTLYNFANYMYKDRRPPGGRMSFLPRLAYIVYIDWQDATPNIDLAAKIHVYTIDNGNAGLPLRPTAPKIASPRPLQPPANWLNSR